MWLQVATLWDELHTRQPWNNALKDDGMSINLDSGSTTNQSSRGLAVLGINTVSLDPCPAAQGCCLGRPGVQACCRSSDHPQACC